MAVAVRGSRKGRSVDGDARLQLLEPESKITSVLDHFYALGSALLRAGTSLPDAGVTFMPSFTR